MKNQAKNTRRKCNIQNLKFGWKIWHEKYEVCKWLYKFPEISIMFHIVIVIILSIMI